MRASNFFILTLDIDEITKLYLKENYRLYACIMSFVKKKNIVYMFYCRLSQKLKMACVGDRLQLVTNQAGHN